jgi:hypothetical protein
MQTQIAPLKELESLRPFIAMPLPAAHASYHWKWTAHLLIVGVVVLYRFNDLVGERAKVKDRYVAPSQFRRRNIDPFRNYPERRILDCLIWFGFCRPEDHIAAFRPDMLKEETSRNAEHAPKDNGEEAAST